MTEEKQGFCTLCKSKCGALYTVENGRLTGVRPDPDHPTGAAMCPKGRAAPEIAHSTGRLTTPLRRTRPKSDPDPGWVPIGWDEAMAEIAARMRTIADESGPEAVAFAVASPSASAISDSIEWLERLVRSFGSPNTVYSTEICNWYRDGAHLFTFGAPLPPPDYAAADLVVLWGFNPAKTWLAQSAALGAATAAGAKLAVIDPRRSTSTLRADAWLRMRPGADAALALGLANLLIEGRDYDEAFVRSWTNAPLLVRADTEDFLRAADVTGGFAQGVGEGVAGADRFVVWDQEADAPAGYDTARAADRPERFALRGNHRIETTDGPVTCVPAFQLYADACAQWPLDRVARTTWIPEREVRALADMIIEAGTVAYYGWTGVAQHANASQIERALATLFALTGSFDAPGGNRQVAFPPYAPATHPGQLAPEQRAKALGIDKHPLGPPASGWINAGDLRTAILTGEPYRIRAVIGFGSNLVMSQPGSDLTAEALRELEFQVHADLFHTPTSSTADIVLPVNSAWEHEALRFGFDIDQRAQEHVQLRQRMVEPQGGSRSDLEIVFDLARRLGLGELFFDGDIEAAWNHQLQPLGLTTEELRARPGGIRVEQPATHHRYARPCPDGTVRGFDTPTRRVELYSGRLAAHGYPPVPVHVDPAPTSRAFPLVLTSAKSGYFVHSQQRSITSLRRRSPEPMVDMSPRAAEARGIGEGQWVELATARGSIRLRARFDASLHPGVVVAEYGWWQAAPDLALPGPDPLAATGSNINGLIDHTVTDPLSGGVPLRSSVCEIRPLPAGSDPSWSGTRPFTVTAIGAQGEGVRTLELAPADGGALPDYRPGQHLTVRAEDATGAAAQERGARSYSLTGPALQADRTAYHLGIRHVPDGSFSGYVHRELEVGDRLHLATPAGVFAIPTHTRHPVVLLAGGIGITPFMSYLETLAATGGSVPEVVLHYGVANSADHPYRARLRELQASIPVLRVVTHYARPLAQDRPGADHTVAGHITADHIDPALLEGRARFYLCGPAAMTDALTGALKRWGVPRFEVFSERFRPAVREVTVPDDASFTVRFGRSGKDVTWTKKDGTLLALGERAGVKMASGCRVGQCESCVTPVLKGAVTHLVTPSEDLPEDDCLTCQSVPASDLTLDA
ncbi:molybdopterin-dependent oxidoreductase [Streptomyces sp. NPDC098789]|uniref:molybdopterin-dependent oxidoreductase n=1 Tax=Streptomyces sp. NPDC098789 TaxID=3366098 RepID=UPI00382A18ED